MHPFSYPLQSGTCPETGLPTFGFSLHDTFITDPFVSVCGRFAVDPSETYGVSREDASALVALNKLLVSATQSALNEGCRVIQEALNIKSGDVAGMHFSDSAEEYPVAKALQDYISAEYDLTDD